MNKKTYIERYSACKTIQDLYEFREQLRSERRNTQDIHQETNIIYYIGKVETQIEYFEQQGQFLAVIKGVE